MPDTSEDPPQRPRWRGMLVVLGGILVHLSLGTIHAFGNLTPYLTSYMRWSGAAPGLRYTDATWVFAVAIMGLGTFMSLGGVIQTRLGTRLSCLLGSWLMSLGVFLTYFTAKYSFVMTVITYGLVFGTGAGMGYAIPLSCSMKWFPERKGLVNGLVVAGFGGGAFVFNQVQRAFINPHNLPPHSQDCHESYFDQPSVLERVPQVFLLLGGCYAAMQLVGCLLLCDPPDRKTTANLDEESPAQNTIRDDPSALRARPVENSSVQSEGTIEDTSSKPSETLRSKHFYILWLIFLTNGQGIVFTSSLWKAYGQTFIVDDTFLALVGSFAALFNALGRIWWGFLADKTSCKVSMLLMNATFTSLMLTFQLTAIQGRETFFLWVCLLTGTFAGSFVLLPTAMAKCFGNKYLTINIGLIFTSMVVTAPVGAFLSQRLMTVIGWTGLFFLVSCFSFLSMLLTFMFSAKDRNGQQI